MLQKFTKEFERILAFIYAPADSSQDMTTQESNGDLNSSSKIRSEVGRIREALTASINYLRFKEFLIEICFMSEQQATTDTIENSLAFELWELIAPKINR